MPAAVHILHEFLAGCEWLNGGLSVPPKSRARSPIPLSLPACPLPCLCSWCRDPIDLVRFGAIEAMTGVVASASAALAASKLGSAREDTVQRQRRGRAWRLLAAQSGMQVGGGG